jgi:S-adenosylmethionine hydrolase
MNTPNSIITLTTDFGVRDGFPGAMHGVILSINPQAKVVDLSHGISPGDIPHGAYILATVPPYFPAGTINVAVIDPGVGTSRKILAVKTDNQIYIAPDNGVLGYVLDHHPEAEVRYLDNPGLWLKNPSATFHGRDIMAPTAAHLSAGVAFHEVGLIANTWEPAPFPPPKKKGDRIHGHIIHVDHFGNLITNIPGETPGDLYVGKQRIADSGRTFGNGKLDEPIVLTGSSGWLEVAVNGGSAALFLNSSVGDEISLHNANQP